MNSCCTEGVNQSVYMEFLACCQRAWSMQAVNQSTACKWNVENVDVVYNRPIKVYTWILHVLTLYEMSIKMYS